MRRGSNSMYSEKLLESLIQKIYDAAIGTVAWASLLICLGNAFSATYPALYLDDPGDSDSSLSAVIGLDEKDIRAYNDYFADRNLWIQGARDRELLKPGIVRSTQMMCSRQDFLRSEWYADFCKPLGFMHGIGVTILQDGTTTSNIGVFADNSRARFGEEDIALLQALLPHLQRGLKMHAHLAAGKARGEALETILNGLSAPVLLVTADRQVLFMNAAAERLIRLADGLVVESGKLRALLSGDTKSLHSLIGGATQISATPGLAANQSRRPGGTLHISRPYGRESLELLISPLPSSGEDWILRQPPIAAIFVTDRSRVAVAKDSLLMRLHGLTAMEAKVAVAASRGLSGKEICRELGISYNTLKTHLKHIYAKTRTKHQSDLVRFLAGGLRLVASDQEDREA